MDEGIAGALLGAILGVIVTCAFLQSPVDLKREAIEKGFAEYNQTTGKWQWKQGENK
jgi:hypothetical protein